MVFSAVINPTGTQWKEINHTKDCHVVKVMLVNALILIQTSVFLYFYPGAISSIYWLNCLLLLLFAMVFNIIIQTFNTSLNVILGDLFVLPEN